MTVGLTVHHTIRLQLIFALNLYRWLVFSVLTSITLKTVTIDFTIALLQLKPKKRVEILIKKDLQKKFEKYAHNFPPKVSDAKVNLYIKPVSKAAWLDEAIEIKITERGKTFTTSIPKHQKNCKSHST